MNLNVPNTLRRMNASVVLNVIRQNSPLSRAQIAKLTGITKATVSEIVSDLLDEKIIYESGFSETGGLGRKGVLVNFDPDHGLGIGIDLGGTKITFSLFNLNAEILAQHQEPTYPVTTRIEFIDRFSASIQAFIEYYQVPREKLRVMGIATPGIVNHLSGVVLEGSPNLPEWDNIPLAAELTSRLNIRVILENDIRAALVGEMWRGKCRHVHSAALIGIGTGLGAALLVDGKIIRGVNNAAGEIGYMMFERSHLSQNWRNKGCFENYCSGSGLSSRIEELSGASMSAKEILQAAASGEHLPNQVVEELADYLTIGIINIVNIANVEKIILTGGVAQSASLFLPRVQANLDRHLFANTRVFVELSELKEQAPLYGIAMLALDVVYPSIRFMPDTQIN
ncbi:ROK family transcriptional regulator [Enterobacteriaceae bacterium H11S18]|uniref:ROK family transcriptional regulator n=1 Tax=Dryocola clanedunensis TaxID=2925396 RepID=UPI0022F0D530|nr:ROK family transcriptional regulator [Dryocola clanedunensis]MCT4706173.1 ROK family transcriptional regulator [Dryocola clanedunensis]MCT4709111.1 ROK family transcriptional regulator [Dryocola clanedunensis]